MRYDTPIYFQHIVRGDYNPDTGDYDNDALTEDEVYASVMDTQAKTMMLVYGQLKQGSLTVHIQNHYDFAYDYIRIGNKRYRADLDRKLKTKETFILSEVQ